MDEDRRGQGDRVRAADPPGTARVRDARRPILVTGSHRSGTTWVGKTLARAPGLLYLSEPFHPDHSDGVCAIDRQHWFLYVCEENEHFFKKDVDRMLRFSYNVRAQLAATRDLRGARQLVGEWRDFVLAGIRKSRPLLKDPIALFSAPWLARSYDMQVVVLIRHPAAFVSSLKRLDWRFDYRNFLNQPLLMRDCLGPFESKIREFAARPPDVIEDASFLWVVIHSAIRRYEEAFPNWQFIRHEDLSLDPVNGFRSMFEGLDLEFTPESRRWVEQSTSSGNPVEAGDGVVHQLSRDSRSNILSWKRRLTEEEVLRIRERVEPLATRYYREEEW